MKFASKCLNWEKCDVLGRNIILGEGGGSP
jgi:hypothetical protein